MRFVWTDEIDRQARSLLATHAIEEIAKIIGCARSTCYARINGKKYTLEQRAKNRAAYREAVPARDDAETVDERPSPEQIRDRDMRAMLPCRDLTAAMFGDPKIGMSQLDARQKSTLEGRR